MTSLRNWLPDGSLPAVMVRASNAVLALGSTVLLARVLGAEAYGTFAFAYVAVGACSILGVMGLDQLTPRELSVLMVRREWSNFDYFLSWSTSRVARVSIAVAVALGTASFLVPLEPDVTETLLRAAPAVPLLAFARLFRGRLQSLGRTALGIFFELPLVNLGLLMLAVVLLLLPDTRRPQWVAAGYVLVVGISAVVAAAAFAWHKPDRGRPHSTQDRLTDWKKATYSFTLLGIMTYLVSNGEVLLIGLFLDTGEVGLYSVANRGASLLLISLTPLQMVAAPKIAGAWSRTDRKEVQRHTSDTAQLALLLVLPAVVAFLLVPGWVLSIFGQEYVEASNALRILTVAQLCLLIVGPGQILLMMTGLESAAVRILAIAFFIQVATTLPLLLLYGLEGAAVGRFCGSFSFALLLGWTAWSQRGILTLPWGGHVKEAHRA